MIFFTADTHFSHGNIIKYCVRPFQNSYEHDESLIANWNSIVTKKDEVYHLGDFGFGSPTYLSTIANKLNGKIYLIRGNHDKSTVKEPCANRFEWIKDLHVLTSQVRGNTYVFCLCHYSLRSWYKSFHGSYCLYGHSHGKLPHLFNSLDVGVDSNNYTPQSLESIVEKIKTENENIPVAQRRILD